MTRRRVGPRKYARTDPIYVSGKSKSATGSTAVNAYNNFLAAAWNNHPPGSTFPHYTLTFPGTFQVSGGEAAFNYNLTGLSGGVAELQIQLATVPNPSDSFILAVNAGIKVDGTKQNVWVAVQDVSAQLGSIINETWRDGSSYTFGGLEWSSVGTRVQHWTATDIDTDSQTVNVAAFVADFIAVPSAPSSASPGQIL